MEHAFKNSWIRLHGGVYHDTIGLSFKITKSGGITWFDFIFLCFHFHISYMNYSKM